MKHATILIFASVLALAGCKAASDENAKATPGTELGIVPASMDKSVAPGDDFFAYANGSWVRNTEIPADRASVGASYIADVTVMRPGAPSMHVEANFRVENGEIAALFLQPI